MLFSFLVFMWREEISFDYISVRHQNTLYGHSHYSYFLFVAYLNRYYTSRYTKLQIFSYTLRIFVMLHLHRIIGNIIADNENSTTSIITIPKLRIYRLLFIKESRILSPIQISIIASVLRPNVPNTPIFSVDQPPN